MTETQKNQLKKICKKIGANKHSFDSLIAQVTGRLQPFQDWLLRGFLLEKETLVAWFGKEEINLNNGETKSEFIARWNNPCVPDPLTVWHDNRNGLWIRQAWQYHAAEIVKQGLTFVEMLEYFMQYENQHKKENS